jgi:hypothetical protein
MPSFSFVVTEHDPERPWIVLDQEHHTVALDDGVVFSVWAQDRWPAPGWSVELDPWQLAPEWVAECPGVAANRKRACLMLGEPRR